MTVSDRGLIDPVEKLETTVRSSVNICRSLAQVQNANPRACASETLDRELPRAYIQFGMPVVPVCHSAAGSRG